MRQGRQILKKLTIPIYAAIAAICLAAFWPKCVAHAAVLSVADCVKCHKQETAEIATSGMAHGTELNCQSCHAGHRPKSANNIPSCSMCHEGEAHFALRQCLSCHDPHTPRELVLSGELKEACQSCHESQGQAMVVNPSMHAEMACNACHADWHKAIPECTDCHESHFSGQPSRECQQCHPAHTPNKILGFLDIRSKVCQDCHPNIYARWINSPSRHHVLNCGLCHQSHGTVPKCTDCHQPAHNKKMLERFKSCLGCHLDAHNMPIL